MTEAGSELAIAVCIKFTVDVNRLRPDPATAAPDLGHAHYRINDFDENALEEAVRLKERHGGRIVGVSLVEREPPRELLLRALAAGLDALYLVPHAAAASGDAFVTATILAAALEEIGAVYEMVSWDLVLCGDASCDTYDGQVGPRVAEALGIVPITYATRLDVRDDTIVAERTIEDYVHVVEATLPALVTVGSETNKPRLPHLRQIMDAGRKPIVRLTAGLGRGALDRARATLELLGVTAPPSARRRMVVGGNGPDDVARKLVRQLQSDGELTQ